ncbi:hypothetical protein [Paraburkholderia pallida]|uniref:Uncharacterized protein n=1 Tax=Paraburkholderia pallida TaxID=2547399 RepID=A0A4P7CYH3_9BURK|nr:hypothetical protein [Paraburkholderia pallida]QBQ99409.1 hypothetical protein E1956_19680 [Paraburkholderia pallida]
MNLREIAGMERVAQRHGLDTARQPIDRAADPWLARYPFFQDALRHGEATFRTLPDYVRTVALKRVTIDLAERAIASRTLDDVRVSFIELSTNAVNEVVQRYLGGQDSGGEATDDRPAASRQTPLPPVPNLNYPLVARPPCLLRPDSNAFLDGWMRFFSYASRGDPTIPLLAVNWRDFHDRLGTLRDSMSGPHKYAHRNFGEPPQA